VVYRVRALKNVVVFAYVSPRYTASHLQLGSAIARLRSASTLPHKGLALPLPLIARRYWQPRPHCVIPPFGHHARKTAHERLRWHACVWGGKRLSCVLPIRWHFVFLRIATRKAPPLASGVLAEGNRYRRGFPLFDRWARVSSIAENEFCDHTLPTIRRRGCEIAEASCANMSNPVRCILGTEDDFQRSHLLAQVSHLQGIPPGDRNATPCRIQPSTPYIMECSHGVVSRMYGDVPPWNHLLMSHNSCRARCAHPRKFSVTFWYYLPKMTRREL